MTRKSKRELERAVDELTSETTDEPMEIVITKRLVETDHPTDYEGSSVSQTRVWRDEDGEWHSESVDLSGGDDDE